MVGLRPIIVGSRGHAGVVGAFLSGILTNHCGSGCPALLFEYLHRPREPN